MTEKLKKIENNLKSDIKRMPNTKIDELFDGLKRVHKNIPPECDEFMTNIADVFKYCIAITKRQKCLALLNDIIDGFDNYPPELQDYVIRELRSLSNIHRPFIEKIISVLRRS